MNSGLLNPDSWEGVLSPAEYPFKLETRTATDSAKSDNPAINTMCLAIYSSDAHDSSLTVALITMNSTDAAIAHYGIPEGSLADSGVDYFEQNNRDPGPGWKGRDGRLEDGVQPDKPSKRSNE